MFVYPRIRSVLMILVLALWSAVPVTDSLFGQTGAQCPSGHSEARLTGWPLNGKTPSGTAKFNESTQVLEVSVKGVALPDGTVLTVFIGDDRIGQLEPLKDGIASGTITRSIPDASRVRVFSSERPLVSANLACVAAPKVTATVSPAITPTVTPTVSPSVSPTPTPTATETPTPSPTVSPGPTAEPTQDPMPKPSPMPTPSPIN